MTYTQFTQEEIDQFNSTVKLSILIATTKDRRVMFNELMQAFNLQVLLGGWKGPGVETRTYLKPRLNEDGTQCINEDDGSPIVDELSESFKHPDIVEILFEEDEKQMSVGAKRQKLLERAKGEYIVYFDSDDFPRSEYLPKIMNAIEKKPDCVGFKIFMTTNGDKPETCIHSLRNPEWKHDGNNYLRGVTIFNPVKKELALKCSFGNLRYGEDKMYSDMLTPICSTEIFIDEYLFDYRYSTVEKHETKYGFDKV